jgi:hypothetical protein
MNLFLIIYLAIAFLMFIFSTYGARCVNVSSGALKFVPVVVIAISLLWFVSLPVIWYMYVTKKY